uniref:Uncharacterized protein n=1 Tax=Ditylenchus dipsaci TaxID=166011 RepID=A0A915E9B1_9BILA
MERCLVLIRESIQHALLTPNTMSKLNEIVRSLVKPRVKALFALRYDTRKQMTQSHTTEGRGTTFASVQEWVNGLSEIVSCTIEKRLSVKKIKPERMVEINNAKQLGSPPAPWERFSHWVNCICVITFDLELGQTIEVIYPEILSSHPAKN